MAVPDLPPGFGFTDPDLYARRVPSEEFAELRRTQPVWWNAQRRGSAGFDDEGYWAVTKHADIIDVGRMRIDPAKLDAIARLGGDTCATIRDRFEMSTPTLADFQKDRSGLPEA